MRTLSILTLLSTLSLGAAISAQAPRLLVSTSSGVNALGTTDGDVLAAGGLDAPRRVFGPEHFRAFSGAVPGDVDALALRPGQTPGTAGSLAISLLSNEGGFLDGDVLGLSAAGGYEVLVSEADLALALGYTGTGVDVDAAAYDAVGGLVFSLQGNLTTTALGAVEDGDILRRAVDGSVARLFTESEVTAQVQATAGVTGAVTDVQALHVENGELWICVQSPSSHDGAVIALGTNSRVVATEDELGLGGAELNALSTALGAEDLMLQMSADSALAGDVLVGTFHGTPNDTLLVLWSGSTGAIEFTQAPGFGRWYLDPSDPWLNQGLVILPTVNLDAQGDQMVGYTPPPSVAGMGFANDMGWSFQAISLGSLQLAAPVRVEVL